MRVLIGGSERLGLVRCLQHEISTMDFGNCKTGNELVTLTEKGKPQKKKVIPWHTQRIINNWIGFLSYFQFVAQLLLLLSLLLLLLPQHSIHRKCRHIFQLEGQCRTGKTVNSTKKKKYNFKTIPIIFNEIFMLQSGVVALYDIQGHLTKGAVAIAKASCTSPIQTSIDR